MVIRWELLCTASLALNGLVVVFVWLAVGSVVHGHRQTQTCCPPRGWAVGWLAECIGT